MNCKNALGLSPALAGPLFDNMAAMLGEITAIVDGWHGEDDRDLWRALRIVLDQEVSVYPPTDGCNEALARAWDEGYEHAIDDYGCDAPWGGSTSNENPYRISADRP